MRQWHQSACIRGQRSSKHENTISNRLQQHRYLIEELGFAGLRFDFSKGYGGEYAGIYARAALGDDVGLAVGEYWVPLKYDGHGKQLYDQDRNRRDLAKWVDETEGRCLAFDFATKGILQVRAVTLLALHFTAT